MHNSPEGESSVPFLKGRRSWPPYKKGVPKFHVVRATDSISGLLKISIHDLLIGYITVLKELSWSVFRPLIFVGAWLHSGEDSSLLRTSEGAVYSAPVCVRRSCDDGFLVADVLRNPLTWTWPLLLTDGPNSGYAAFIVQPCLQVLPASPGMNGVHPDTPLENSNVYSRGLDNWVSFKSVNMVTLFFFPSCTWLYSVNISFFIASRTVPIRQKEREGSGSRGRTKLKGADFPSARLAVHTDWCV